MALRSVGVMAATALVAANAFLLPPAISSDDTVNTIGIAVVKPSFTTIEVPCGDCVPKSEGTDAASAKLVFKITTMNNGYGLGLPETYTLYPPIQSYLRPIVNLRVTHKDSHSEKDVQITADSTIISEESFKDDQSLLKIKYQIGAIDHSEVTVAPIHITAIKGADNTVNLLTAIPETEEESKPKHGRPGKHGKHGKHGKNECKDLPAMLCRFHNVFSEGLSKLKDHLPELPGLRPGCLDGGRKHGKKPTVHVLPGHIRPTFQPLDTDLTVPMPPHGSPHHGGPHFAHGRPHGYHHRRPSVLVRILKTIAIVLVPITLGITMGIFVSFIGMIIGRLVVFLWVHLVRGGKKGYASVKLSEEEAQADDSHEVESVGEAPPMYEDVPEYTEKTSPAA